MLVADADVPSPVIRALQTLRYPIVTYDEIGAPVRPDTALMAHVLDYVQESPVLVTKDTGIPSQAYVGRYAQAGLTVVLLRWKTSTYLDFQKMAELILRDGQKWIEIASRTPSVISVSRHGSRPRAWSRVPSSLR